MNVNRSPARTPGAARPLVRQALGDDAVVMSTRPCAEGVEVLAMAPESILQLERIGAEAAAARAPTEHTDRTDWPFITLDPATSTDLDQAFTIERSGDDLLLHYAIADVAWFVQPGDALDHEAWKRGATLYLPDGKAGLYPPALAEGAASLLPDGPRPAVVFHVRVAGDGAARLDGAERAVIRSRAKLAYDSVTAADLPADFDEFPRRVPAAPVPPGAGFQDAVIAVVGVVRGGLGSLPGAVLGGLLLGFVEVFSGYFIGTSMKQVVYFAVFVLVLVVRPAGLLGQRGSEEMGLR